MKPEHLHGLIKRVYKNKYKIKADNLTGSIDEGKKKSDDA